MWVVPVIRDRLFDTKIPVSDRVLHKFTISFFVTSLHPFGRIRPIPFAKEFVKIDLCDLFLGQFGIHHL